MAITSFPIATLAVRLDDILAATSGQVTFAGAASRAVTFGTPQVDTSYRITATGNVNETFWVTSKTTSGFTINSSNATSTAVVDWHLFR